MVMIIVSTSIGVGYGKLGYSSYPALLTSKTRDIILQGFLPGDYNNDDDSDGQFETKSYALIS